MRTKGNRLFILAVLLAVTAAWLHGPTQTRAGDLDPSAPPGSTMKTLDQIPPTWSQSLESFERFQIVMNDEAVLDKETGLVWEYRPQMEVYDWFAAVNRCHFRTIGNRKGWRLPTVEELASLVDTSMQGPALPAGHPFFAVSSDHYWSHTIYPHDPNTTAWYVDFGYGALGRGRAGATGRPYKKLYWCVRGGHGHDGLTWGEPWLVSGSRAE